MDFFDNRCFRLHKVLTCLIGQWPYQRKRQRIIISILYCFMNFSLVTVTVNGLLTLNLNFDDILNNITIIITGIGVGIKLFNCIFNTGKMRSLLDGIKSNWMSMSNPEVEILKQCSEKGRLLIVAYIVVVYTNMSLFLLTSYTPQFLDFIKPLNESRPRKRVYKSNYLVNDEKYFYYILLHEQLTVFLYMTTVICVDTMYVKYAEQACGIFSVLRYRLKYIINSSDFEFSKGYTSKNDEEITKEVSFCIAFHQNAIKYAETIQSAYGTALFIQISMSMVLLSSTSYVVVVKMEAVNEFMQILPFALGQIAHIFYNTLPGQKLMNSSEKIAYCVYNTQWNRLPSKAQKLLILMMFRSCHRPCSIKACGGLFTLSMETFSSSMKTSFSYFTVLLSMKD